jgi:hypothetical protein
MTTKRLQIKKRDTGHRPSQSAELTELVTQGEQVRLNVQMSKSKRQALKAKAVMEGRTVHEIINQLVDEYLN